MRYLSQSRKVSKLSYKKVQRRTNREKYFSKSSGLGYRDIVKTFIANGNCVNHYDITQVAKSCFAFPLNIQMQIKGETSMSWTAFVAKFKDNRYLSFGTTWNWEFFNLPDSYNVEDIVEIVNHSYLLKTGEIVGHRSFDRVTRKDELEVIQSDRQFFECYIDNL